MRTFKEYMSQQALINRQIRDKSAHQGYAYQLKLAADGEEEMNFYEMWQETEKKYMDFYMALDEKAWKKLPSHVGLVLFRYPEPDDWHKMLRAAFVMLKRLYGITRKEVTVVEGLMEGDWEANQDPTKFAWDGKQFAMVSPGKVSPPPPQVSAEELEAKAKERERAGIEWLKASYKRAGYDISDEQALKLWREKT